MSTTLGARTAIMFAELADNSVWRRILSARAESPGTAEETGTVSNLGSPVFAREQFAPEEKGKQ